MKCIEEAADFPTKCPICCDILLYDFFYSSQATGDQQKQSISCQGLKETQGVSNSTHVKIKQVSDPFLPQLIAIYIVIFTGLM